MFTNAILPQPAASSACQAALGQTPHRSTAWLLVESEFIPDGIGEYCNRAHAGPDIRTRRENPAPSGLNTLQSVRNDINHDVGPRVFVRGSIALLYPSPAHATSIVEGQFPVPAFPNLPAENTAVEVGGRFGRIRRYFQIADLAVGHVVSNRGCEGSSGTFDLVVPDLRLPELDLVSVRVHDPRKLAVLVRFGSFDDFHTPRTQLVQQLVEVVDPVVDHEGRSAWAEPLAVFLRDMPHSKASILGLVVRPFEDSAAKVFQRHAQVLPIPRCQCSAVACALEEDAADSGNLRHPCPPTCLAA